MKKKTWAIVLSVVLVLALAITGTIAYLTDRDSATNVFTMGNVAIDLTEDFEQGATLTPGVKIEKVPTITNTGKNDAWVWMAVAIPSALDNYSGEGQVGSNNNVIHWNCTGATWEGAVAQKYVDSAIEKGLLPAGTKAEDIKAANTTWNVNDKVEPYQNAIDGVSYNIYTLLYNKALVPGESTLPGLTQMYMDATVDIDPDGNLAKVVNGVVTPIDWNINDDGAPVVYVSAYAIQKESFADAKAAYDAYMTQWGGNGTEWGTPAKVVEVSDLDGLKDALKGEDPVIVDGNGKDLGDLDDVTFEDGTVIRDMIFTGDANLGSYGNNANGTVTFINCTFTSEYAYAAHFDGGNGKLIFIDCKFEGWNSFGTAITGLTFKNCTFGHNGYYGIARVYQDATFTECTFASDFEGVDTNVEGTVVHFNNCTGISADNIYNNTDSKGVVSRGVWYIDGVDVSDQIKAW